MAPDHFHWPGSPTPSPAELAELSHLRERFRGHRIYWYLAEERGICYTAHRARTSARPHTIITADLNELRDELERAAPPDPLAWQRTLVQVALADPDADAESLRAAHARVLASGAHQQRIAQARGAALAICPHHRVGLQAEVTAPSSHGRHTGSETP